MGTPPVLTDPGLKLSAMHIVLPMNCHRGRPCEAFSPLQGPTGTYSATRIQLRDLLQPPLDLEAYTVYGL